MFNQLFYSAFSFYKTRFKKNANSIATIYISMLQISIIFLLGVFFSVFFKQMHVDTMSQDKALLLFVLTSVFIYFKNWVQYSGRKRKVLNAKMIKSKSKPTNIWLLWLIPIALISLSIILLKAI